MTHPAHAEGAGVVGWTLWSAQRPTDTKAKYRWRIAMWKICGMLLRPEWTDGLHLHGMGHSESEWWPSCSHWDGYSRTVPATLEWRVAGEAETEILWVGLDLLPCPFTGEQPVISYKGRWVTAPPWQAESLTLRSYMIQSYGWENAAKLRDTWNRRPSPISREG